MKISGHIIPAVERSIPCCWGYAMGGPLSCTCWSPVYDTRQSAITNDTELSIRSKRCEDCAFRSGSPELKDDSIWEIHGTFYCHQGMRRIIAWQHENGERVDHIVNKDDYDPPIKNNIPYRTNGKQADICHGWRVLNRRFECQGKN